MFYGLRSDDLKTEMFEKRTSRKADLRGEARPAECGSVEQRMFHQLPAHAASLKCRVGMEEIEDSVIDAGETGDFPLAFADGY